MSKYNHLTVEVRFRSTLGGWQARIYGVSPTHGIVEWIYTECAFTKWHTALRIGLREADSLARNKSLFPKMLPQIETRTPAFSERQRAVKFFDDLEKEKA